MWLIWIVEIFGSVLYALFTLVMPIQYIYQSAGDCFHLTHLPLLQKIFTCYAMNNASRATFHAERGPRHTTTIAYSPETVTRDRKEKYRVTNQAWGYFLSGSRWELSRREMLLSRNYSLRSMWKFCGGVPSTVVHVSLEIELHLQKSNSAHCTLANEIQQQQF